MFVTRMSDRGAHVTAVVAGSESADRARAGMRYRSTRDVDEQEVTFREAVMKVRACVRVCVRGWVGDVQYILCVRTTVGTYVQLLVLPAKREK